MKLNFEVKISENGFVFNSGTGDSFRLNPTGLELIRMISEEKEYDEIFNLFSMKYDVDELTFEKDFYEFFSMLKHFQMISGESKPEFK